jgi:phospholipid/cholesterol/gamma-HCH transport system substrate-binding protein
MGLRVGSPVWYSGIEIGSVKNIELHPEYGTLVTMSINHNVLQFIKKDSKASILTMGLLGDKYVELSVGSPGLETIKPGDIIEGETQIAIKDIVNASSDSITKITQFVEKLESLLEKFEKSEGTVAKFLTDPSIYNNLKTTTETLTEVVKDFKESQGSLKMFIEDPSIYNKMLDATSSLEDFSTKLNKGKGTLKMLVENPEIYENLSKASQKLSNILEQINSGEGIAGSLVSDKELAIEMKDSLVEFKIAINEFNELIAEIRENPGKYIKFSVF